MALACQTQLFSVTEGLINPTIDQVYCRPISSSTIHFRSYRVVAWVKYN